MKLVLVTGANRGIGLETARQLDALGHSVILGSRDFQKGVTAAGTLSEKVIVRQLDVTSEESIRNVFDFVKMEFGKLDVLINNAGIGTNHYSDKKPFSKQVRNILEEGIPGLHQAVQVVKPILKKTGIVNRRAGARNVPIADVKSIMETNLYGAWRMAQVFIPLLEKSEDGRIINVSSGMGELNSLTGEYPGYSLSKASLNALTIMLANELRGKGINVYAMCPGWVRTDMGGPFAPRHVSQGADTAVWLATEQEIPTGKFFRDRKVIEW